MKTSDPLALLEEYLARAKQTPFVYLGLFTLRFGPRNELIAGADFAGSEGVEYPALTAADLLRTRLHQKIEGWRLPPRDPSLAVNYVTWNLAQLVLGFDFIAWLVNAEMIRRRVGAPAPLRVGFYLGTDPEIMKVNNREQWLHNVYRPAVKMLGAIEDGRAQFGHPHNSFVFGPIVKAFRNGEAVPTFSSGLESPYAGCVTITLRETDYTVHRNSRVAEWIEVARYLKEHGETVVFVRDTAKAHEPIDDFDTCPAASINLINRVALYEHAKLNLCDGGGPWQMCLFGDRPWLAFMQPEEESESAFQPATRHYWHENQGIEIGEQFPWCNEKQRIVWQAGTYDTIIAAIRAVMGD